MRSAILCLVLFLALPSVSRAQDGTLWAGPTFTRNFSTTYVEGVLRVIAPTTRRAYRLRLPENTISQPGADYATTPGSIWLSVANEQLVVETSDADYSDQIVDLDVSYLLSASVRLHRLRIVQVFPATDGESEGSRVESSIDLVWAPPISLEIQQLGARSCGATVCLHPTANNEITLSGTGIQFISTVPGGQIEILPAVGDDAIASVPFVEDAQMTSASFNWPPNLTTSRVRLRVPLSEGYELADTHTTSPITVGRDNSAISSLVLLDQSYDLISVVTQNGSNRRVNIDSFDRQLQSGSYSLRLGGMNVASLTVRAASYERAIW